MATDSYSFSTAVAPDAAAPYSTNHSPAPGATGVAVNTLITLELRDAGVGVDQSTIAMRVNGSAVSPVISGTPAAYILSYDAPVDFGYEETVTVEVDASDLNGNTMATDTYSFTTTTPTIEVMYIGSIVVTKQSWWILRSGRARVQIVDTDGSPVEGATINGQWSGGASDNDLFTTGSDGWGTTNSNWRWGDATFTFCVTNVSKEGWSYDPEANVVTCANTD